LFDVLNIDFMDNEEKLEFLSKLKPNTFFERVQEQYGVQKQGFRTKLPTWSNEYPLIVKKIERAENEFLKPKGITNQVQLDEKIFFYESEMKKLDDKKLNITTDEYKRQKVEEVKRDLAQRQADGLRKASTYTQRVFEFKTSTEDYEGNLLLDSLQEPKKKKDKVVDVVKVPELNETEIIEKRILGLEMVVEDEEDSEIKSILEKRILALKMLIE